MIVVVCSCNLSVGLTSNFFVLFVKNLGVVQHLIELCYISLNERNKLRTYFCRYPNLSHILGILNFPNMLVGLLVTLICSLTLSCIVPNFSIKRLLFSFYQQNCSYLIVSSVTEVNKSYPVCRFVTYV